MIHHYPEKTRQPGSNSPEVTENGNGKQPRRTTDHASKTMRGSIKTNHEPRTTQCILRKRSVMMCIMKQT